MALPVGFFTVQVLPDRLTDRELHSLLQGDPLGYWFVFSAMHFISPCRVTLSLLPLLAVIRTLMLADWLARPSGDMAVVLVMPLLLVRILAVTGMGWLTPLSNGVAWSAESRPRL